MLNNYLSISYISELKVGLRLPQTTKNHATKDNILNLAKQAENAGFDSLWVLERLIWPIDPLTPYPRSKDGSFPFDWQYIFDPLETLTFVAANTEKIYLGTSVIDMLFHNPVILAKRFATLDILSNGRSMAGLGIGWSEDEYRVSNIPFKDRGKRADEYLQLLKKMWTDNIVEFKGQFYNIPPSIVGPKPIQKPHIPIYLGGYNQKTFARIAGHANGWICVIHDSLEQLKAYLDKIKSKCYKISRDPKEIHVAAILYPNIADSANHLDSKEQDNNKHHRGLLHGSIDQVGNDLIAIRKLGVDHIILNYNRSLVSNDIDTIIDLSKQLASFVK
ncbi:MAG: LLM class F420-dependent oxidoreductase [Nitrososphaeraceae archaeon]